ncbi:hypothetical protein [Halorarum halobium]|uniref:hypothetical protein n=1 Tax=Halorarum halobium TaxID=3075121 RepID=UPI0028AED01F|nr:hypothetical protein [Halobaculum sp. XH14]
MAEVQAATTEPVNVFPVDGAYLVRHYFEGDAVFDRLKPFYDNRAYRFEIPRGEFTAIREFLYDHGYSLTVVEDLERYLVVVEKYTAHPDDVFKTSVAQFASESYNCFLLKDREAVRDAVGDGAHRFPETTLEFQQRTLRAYA